MHQMLPAIRPEDFTPSVILVAFLGLLVMTAGGLADIAVIVRLSLERPSWSMLAQRIRSRPWSWVDVARIALVILAILLSFLLCFKIRLALDPNTPISALLSVAAGIAVLHGGGYLVISRLMHARVLNWESAFGLSARRALHDVGLGLLFYLSALPLVFIAAIVSRLLLLAMHVKIEPQQVVDMLAKSNEPWGGKVALALFAATAAPFVEELLFRGAALPCLLKHARPVLAVLAVSVAFACFHNNIAALLPLFVIAVAFSLAYIYSGSILVPVVMHAAFNGVNLLLLLIARDVPNLAWLF